MEGDTPSFTHFDTHIPWQLNTHICLYVFKYISRYIFMYMHITHAYILLKWSTFMETWGMTQSSPMMAINIMRLKQTKKKQNKKTDQSSPSLYDQKISRAFTTKRWDIRTVGFLCWWHHQHLDSNMYHASERRLPFLFPGSYFYCLHHIIFPQDGDVTLSSLHS